MVILLLHLGPYAFGRWEVSQLCQGVQVVPLHQDFPNQSILDPEKTNERKLQRFAARRKRPHLPV